MTAAGDRKPLFKLLRDKVGGRLSEAIESLQSVHDLSLTQFVEACRSGVEVLNKTFGITPAQGERLAEAEPGVLMHVEELDLPPTTSIRLNTAPAGEPPAWQALEALSTGQKATAVLLLLLLESEAPLIVDQPEDDLDNRFITGGRRPAHARGEAAPAVPFLHPQCQHPVLGDAELIVGLAATGEAEHGRARIAPEHMGSIDTTLVRELVEEILEGGKKPSSVGAGSTVLRSGAMTRTELEELIRSGENSGVEFKRDDIIPERLAKELAALLNLRGGHLLLGG